MSIIRRAACLSAAATILCGLAPTAIAFADQATPNVTRENAQYFSFSSSPDGRDVIVNLTDGYSFVKEGDSVSVVDDDGNVTEVLPTVATDSNGDPIEFYYWFDGENKLHVTRTEVGGYVTYGWWSKWGKCVAGTAGSALVGSAGGPAGTVGGALVGAATFC
ncbi:hypothetical protein [Corynebacterium uterequi]|uniref:hypothetical protein n=1 Tax=Corynebacterium uterequi TaxID=1072256 RepID=UPI0009E515D1|nr:hypothetical protein [Corynebacterium uterequi]